MTRYLLFIALPVLLSSCYAYKIYPVEYRNYSYVGEKQKAYVVNKGLKREYIILQNSGIFELTDDSTAATKIQLHKLERRAACGQPVIASAFTLGQLPVYLPDHLYYGFDEITGNTTVKKQFDLQIAERIWFWDMFTFQKNLKQKAGKALLAYYHENKKQGNE